MGYFSWLTSDTEESIMNNRTNKCRTVYMLQPDGKPPIVETDYEGYGDFGGVDAYIWVGQHNLPPERLQGLANEQIRNAGLAYLLGHYYRDTTTGQKFAIFHHGPNIIDPNIRHHAIRYDQPVPGYDGRTIAELKDAGLVEVRTFDVKYPLKFSFNPNAVYEDLPPAKDCPRQGYFDIEEEDEDEDEDA